LQKIWIENEDATTVPFCIQLSKQQAKLGD